MRLLHALHERAPGREARKERAGHGVRKQSDQPWQLAPCHVADWGNENEPGDALGVAGSDLPSDRPAEGVAYERCSPNAELVEELHDQVSDLGPTVAAFRIGSGETVAGQIQPDHPKVR
jgi:hypothetical protein